MLQVCESLKLSREGSQLVFAYILLVSDPPLTLLSSAPLIPHPFPVLNCTYVEVLEIN